MDKHKKPSRIGKKLTKEDAEQSRKLNNQKGLSEVLKELEIDYSIIIENMLNGFALHEIILDKDGKPCDYRFLEVNPSFEKLTGLKKENIIGKTALEVLPGLEPYWIDTYGKVAMTGKPVQFEYYSQSLNKHYLVNAFSPKKGYFVTIFSELGTESQNFKKYFEQYLEYTSILFLVLDKKGHVSLINKKGVELLGYPEEDIIGKDWFINFLPEEIRSETKEYFMKALRGEVPIESYYENPVITKNGMRTFLWQNTLLKDASGKIFGILASAEDITERKKTEDALRASEVKYRRLFEAAKDGILIIDAETGMIVDVNPYLMELLGCSAEHFIGKTLWEVGLAKDIIASKNKFAELLRKEYVHYDDLPLKTANGQRIDVEFVSNMYLVDQKKVIQCNIRDITERKQAEEALKKSNEQLKKMYDFQSIAKKLNQFLLVCKSEDEIYKEVCDTFMEFSLIKFVWIGLIEKGTFDVKPVAYAGIEKGYINSIKAKWDNSPHGMGPTGIAIKTQKPFVIGDIRTDPTYMPWRKEALKRNYLSIISLPLIYEGAVIGVMDIYSDRKDAFAEEDIELFKEVANDIAVGIKSIRLETNLQKKSKQLEKSVENIVFTMAKMSELKDPYTAGHQQRVSQLAAAIAKKMGLSQDRIEAVRFASLIHDIGKFNIPGEILTKPSKLSETEFALIKDHPKTGYDIIKDVDFPWDIASIILQHHERLDGSGYPMGLKDKEIVLEAEILAVADVIEAMSSHRPYRPALGIDKALEEISMNKGRLYDPEVVDACIKLFKEDGFKFE